MRFGEATCDLSHDWDRLFGFHTALSNSLAELDAFEQFHRHIETFIGGFAHIEEADGVGMRELSNDASFAKKSHDDARIHRKHRR